MFGVIGQHMLYPFAGGFTVNDSPIFAFIASGILKKKKRKESYIILLVWTDLAYQIALRMYLRYRFCGLCDKIPNEHFWG